MEDRTLLILLTVLFIIAVIASMVWDNVRYSGKNYILGWLCMMLFDLLFFPEPKHITIEKSSDSEWVRSKFDYPDTVITSVKVLEHKGKIDTVYPTIIYKRIEL